MDTTTSNRVSANAGSQRVDASKLARAPGSPFADPAWVARVRLYRELLLTWTAFDYMIRTSEQQPKWAEMKIALAQHGALGNRAPAMPQSVAEYVSKHCDAPRKRGRKPGIPRRDFLRYWRVVRRQQWMQLSLRAERQRAPYETALLETATAEIDPVCEKTIELWRKRIPLPVPDSWEE